MGASAIFSLGGALGLRTIEIVRFRFAEKTQNFFSGGELGSTGRAKRELRVEVDRLASLKADYKFQLPTIKWLWPPKNRRPRV